MLIHPVSDIHLEFSKGKFKYPVPQCDVVICAGDISPGVAGIMWAAETFDVPIIYVAGNHEFYGKRFLAKHYEKMNNKAQELGVHFLQNSTCVIDGVRFVGCTLWTDFNLMGNQPLAMIQAQQTMNDYKQIHRDIKQPITAQDIWVEYTVSFNFLQDELAKPHDGPTVVVTHHAPSERSCEPKFSGHPHNSSYASNLDKFIEITQPALWVHGHVHDAQDYVIGQTQVIANPRGYASHDEQTGFDSNLIIQV